MDWFLYDIGLRHERVNEQLNAGSFLLRIYVDLLRACSLHVISRNHSNTFLLITLQKTKTCIKIKYYSMGYLF